MAYWKQLHVDGVYIDLSHLEPFFFEVTHTASHIPASIEVIFSSHCFSERTTNATHKDTLPRTHLAHNETRVFDKRRYELSKSLPKHISNLSTRSIVLGRDNNYIHVTLEDGEDYAIFFVIHKHSANTCKMRVVSAYPLTKPHWKVKQSGEMKFKTLVAKVLQGTPIKFPRTGR